LATTTVAFTTYTGNTRVMDHAAVHPPIITDALIPDSPSTSTAFRMVK
jgi:hypothetical protein